MLIGVISDTHGLLRPEALKALAVVEHILHAGDIGNAQIIPQLATIAPVTAIRGNVDTEAWADGFPLRALATFGGRRIYLIHDRADLGFDPAAEGFDIVISGHSHKPAVEVVSDVVYLNPGSAGPRRFRLPITLATIDLRAAPLRPEIITLVR